jgi:hypothetical protein
MLPVSNKEFVESEVWPMHKIPAVWGLIFAGVTIVMHLFFGREMSILVAAILMGMIGAIYVGFAIIDGRIIAIAIESVVALIFGLAGLGGVLVSPWFLIAALISHAIWDMLHHLPSRLATTPGWYVPYCAIYDIGAALGLAVVWFAPFLR